MRILLAIVGVIWIAVGLYLVHDFPYNLPFCFLGGIMVGVAVAMESD